MFPRCLTRVEAGGGGGPDEYFVSLSVAEEVAKVTARLGDAGARAGREKALARAQRCFGAYHGFLNARRADAQCASSVFSVSRSSRFRNLPLALRGSG
jgi:hypothetical protein